MPATPLATNMRHNLPISSKIYFIKNLSEVWKLQKTAKFQIHINERSILKSGELSWVDPFWRVYMDARKGHGPGRKPKVKFKMR